MKVLVGLGNPGPRYDGTRHNVGWWALDRIAFDHGFGPFVQMQHALVSEGTVSERPVRLVKPTTYMNRSGAALTGLRALIDFSIASDLLVVVDDAVLDAGRIRLRPSGGSGGHNGLESIERALGTEDYPRLRIGVGIRPGSVDMADWVLSPMTPEDEDVVLELLPEISAGAAVWIDEGLESAMNRLNR